MMEKLGFDCELADNGLKGLDLLKEDRNRADLVLMDLRYLSVQFVQRSIF